MLSRNIGLSKENTRTHRMTLQGAPVSIAAQITCMCSKALNLPVTTQGLEPPVWIWPMTLHASLVLTPDGSTSTLSPHNVLTASPPVTLSSNSPPISVVSLRPAQSSLSEPSTCSPNSPSWHPAHTSFNPIVTLKPFHRPLPSRPSSTLLAHSLARSMPSLLPAPTLQPVTILSR